MFLLLFAHLLLPSSASAYQEAPELAKRVARGQLPPVEQRLPVEPAVVQPIERVGTYGGTWRRMTLGNRDIQLECRMGYEPIVRWDPTGRHVVPGLAKSWEIQDDGRTYYFHLRKGLKWSDGNPLTSEDFVFACNDFLCDREINPVYPSWLRVRGKPAKVWAPDPCTVAFSFAEPYGLFLEMLAYTGYPMPLAKHYMRQFHGRYADKTVLDAMTKKAGLTHWRDLFILRQNLNENPELPSCRAWVVTEPPPSTRVIAKRNPYYWEVDTAGNQLPYIDELAYTDVQNGEIVTLRALAGQVDFQARRIDASNYSLFMQNREKGGYRVLRDENPNTVCLFINQYSKDDVLRPLLQDRRFRIALSVALNRDEIVDVLYSGMARPARGVSSPLDDYYLPEFDAKYIEYDPGLANQLLDELGLKPGRDGTRLLPDGRPFRPILNVFPSETGSALDLWQLAADYWREVGLDFVVHVDSVALSVLQMSAGNTDFWAYIQTGIHWVLDPLLYIPTNRMSYFAPAYGRYIGSEGKDQLGVKPPPEFMQLVDWYRELTTLVVDEHHPENAPRRLELGHRIMRQWAEQSYIIGVCRPDVITIVSNRMRNVPKNIIHEWTVMTPGYIGLEQFFFDRSPQERSPTPSSEPAPSK